MENLGIDLSNYINLGLGGVAIYFIYKLANQSITFAGNHVDHNTEAVNNLAVAITELTAWLKARNGQ